MDVRTGFVVAGVVFGLLAGLVNEVLRRRRVSRRRTFAREGIPAAAEVEAVWPAGRNGNRREVHLRVVDADGNDHLARLVIRAVEAGAVGLWEGAMVRVHHRIDDPTSVMLDRPAVSDDHGWVSLAAAGVVLSAFVAAGTFV